MNRKVIKLNANLYEKIEELPFFFVRLYERIFYDDQGEEHDNSEWQSIDKDLGINFSASNFGKRDLGYCLCFIERAKLSPYTEEKDKNMTIEMYIYDAPPSEERDYFTILSNCISRFKDKEDKYAFVELLWFLDKEEINTNAILNAIKHYNNHLIPFVLDIIRRISRCLSVKKQKVIKSILSSFGSHYDIYMPEFITEAILLCEPSCNKDNLNIFQLVDHIINFETGNIPTETYASNKNLLLQLHRWLDTEQPLRDYNILKPLFSIVSEPIRLKIVKRYFHDIRLGNTPLDLNLLGQFKDNQYDEFIRFRYATETPMDRIVLTVPLLCDSLITLYNSKGETLQTFDGVLDFAMTHCDKTHPSIDFRLDRFIPKCNQGAVYNSSSFKGFIDYQIICKIKVSELTDSSLLDYIRRILDETGRRKQYPVCKYGDGTKIDDEQFTRCSQIKSKDGDTTSRLECYTYKNYDEKWLVEYKPENLVILNSFLKEKIAERENCVDIDIDISMVSLNVFRDFILSIPSLFEDVGNEEFLVNSYKIKDRTYHLRLVEQYADILRMRIFPQKDARVGIIFDVFGFWHDIQTSLTPNQLRDKKSEEYKTAYNSYVTKEAEEVKKRTIESLKKELNIHEYNGSYFEVSYDRSTLVKLINKYYFKESFRENEDTSTHEFLTQSYIRKFLPYCAPKLSETNNPAINLPYFWCRGKECFHNNLERQTLLETNEWGAYTLYHLIEIMGYPKIHSTIAGNEPDSVIRNFIAVTNKAIQKFYRLKCRSCGHLIFTDKSSGFNRYNYYSCINPNCSEAWKPIYLSYCYKCKKGLIDSRDTKQCPNGWYICPKCLACCDDAQYERLAQRYFLSNRPVPTRIEKMLGLGHNDKGDHYCPDCGAHIEITKDVHGDYFQKCPSCQKNFNTEQYD
jgi:hypothetical protein